MRLKKSFMAGLAAAGLMTAQTAVAADAPRQASPVSDSEKMAGNPGVWVAVIAVGLVALVSIISATSDDDPESP